MVAFSGFGRGLCRTLRACWAGAARFQYESSMHFSFAGLLEKNFSDNTRACAMAAPIHAAQALVVRCAEVRVSSGGGLCAAAGGGGVQVPRYRSNSLGTMPVALPIDTADSIRNVCVNLSYGNDLVTSKVSALGRKAFLETSQRRPRCVSIHELRGSGQLLSGFWVLRQLLAAGARLMSFRLLVRYDGAGCTHYYWDFPKPVHSDHCLPSRSRDGHHRETTPQPPTHRLRGCAHLKAHPGAGAAG